MQQQVSEQHEELEQLVADIRLGFDQVGSESKSVTRFLHPTSDHAFLRKPTLDLEDCERFVEESRNEINNLRQVLVFFVVVCVWWRLFAVVNVVSYLPFGVTL